MAMRNSIYQKNILNPNRTLSFVNTNNQNYIFNPFIPQNTKLNLEYILSLVNKDSNVKGPPYNSVKILCLYIRKNRNSIEEIINKISNYFDVNIYLNINLVLNIVNSILVLLIEKSQIMTFLNKILPILVKRLFNTNIKNLTLIENICNTIGNLIKIGGIYIRRLLVTSTDDLFKNLNNFDPKNFKNENYLFASLLFLCKIIENSSLFAYSKITEKPNFSIFMNIIDNFKDPKYEVRYAVGELIKQFNHMLVNRDYKTKYSYEQMIYYKVFRVYTNHLKENYDIPSNINIILGLIEVLKNIYISEPLFLKSDKIYVNLVSNLMKCRNSKVTQIRVEFFKFIPELYQINKEIFTKKYLKDFFEYCNKYLTLKANNEIRNALLMTLGNLSLYVKKETFDICKEQLIILLNSLIMEKKIFDVEIFKCLADLLNNKGNFYMEIVVTKFNPFFILSKLFKSGLTTYKIEFLISIMTAFSSFSMEHITTVIASLNVVSLILWDEDFKIEYFYKEIDDKINNFIDPKLEGILVNIKKYIKKYLNNITINENNDNENQENMINDFSSLWYNKYKCLNDWRIMIFALTLFSQIENNLFLKDMLIFYNDKILPFLLISSNKIKKKILELILCKFVKIYNDDINYSNYILNNIIDSIRNLIFSIKDIPIRIFAFNILHKKPILLDIILQKKEFFFSKLLGLLSTDEDLKIKEKLIETIGILAKRSENKNYFITFVKKNINNILFSIDNCDDIIHKENLIFLLLFYTLYLKEFFDLKLMKQIIEVLINLNINYEYQGIIFIDTLKIVYELLNTDIINNNFISNENDTKINQFCHILLIICVNNLKEGGDNTTKTEIILKVLYQIVKIQKINIYQDINTNIISESLDSFDFNYLRNSLTFNSKVKKQKSSKNNNILDIDIDIDNNIENNYFKNKENNINDNYKKELLSNIKTDEKINLMDILFQCIIKGLNDESLKTIMNIFGLSGAMDPSEMEKSINQDISNYQLDGQLYEQDYFDDNEFKLTKYNAKTKMNEEINLSNIEPSTYKPILLILKILKENSQQDLTGQIINSFNSLISNLEQKDEKLIEIIMLTIIQVIPQVDINYQEILLSYLNNIMRNFNIKIKNYLSDLVKLSKDFIYVEQCTSKCCNILNYLFENFINEMEIYYPSLIPIFLSFLNLKKRPKKDKKEKIENTFIKFFISMANNPNIISYLNIILDELSSLFLMTNEFNSNLFEFFQRVVSLNNSYYFYPIIINTLIEKINIFIKELIPIKERQNKNYLDQYLIQGPNVEGYKKFIDKIIEIFKKMNQINREHFITFLPTIIRYLKGLGLIKYINYEKEIQPMILEYSNYNFISVDDFQNIISSQICFINCIFGFNKVKKKENIKPNPLLRKSYNIKSSENNINKVKDENTITTKKSKKSIQSLNNTTTRNRKNSINNDLIIKTFDTSNCVVEEDWQEWFKSTTKVLFDQSPSNTLYYCRFIADYYFPLIIELYNYAFFLAYINNNDQSKILLTDDLQTALQNPKTPNEILLTILNLAEFIERRNVNMIFYDYYQFGEVAYKCRAFAKALYYKENNFIIKNDFDDIEDLIELYYELKLPESAIGLLKLAEKNKDKIRKRNNSINNYYDRKSLIDNSFTENNHGSITFEKKDKDKEYIWYIKMHNYNEALEIILKQLEKEKNKKNISVLKKNKDICLNGLCDWEQLLSSNDNNNIDDNIINNENCICNEENGLNLQEILAVNELNPNHIIENNSIKEENETNDNEINNNKNNENNKNNMESNANNNTSNIINDSSINNSINNKMEIEEDKLKENIEKEILLSKACMNLGEWTQLKKHLSNIKQLFKSNNDIEEQILINSKEDKKNDIYDVNGINEDNIINSAEDDENFFFINHGYSYGTNMNSLEKDFINLNKYISNYNKNKLQTRSFSDNNNKANNKNNSNINEEEPEIFICYQDIINNNQNLNFLANNEDILFDLNLYSTVLNVEKNRYNLALKYISEGKKIILTRIKSLLSESYIRGYELLVKNQMLYNLEQIIDYKQNHSKEKLFFNNMVESWNNNLEFLGQDPYIYEKFLAIRSLVIPIDQEYDKYFNLVKICRKLNLFSQSKKLLLRLKNKLNIKNDIGFYKDLKMNEIHIKIELIYNKCLFEKGDIKEAIDNSKYIVDLLENSENNKNIHDNILFKVSNKIKSRIYGHYAIFKHKNFSFKKNIVYNIKEEININDLNNLRLSHGIFSKTTCNFGNNNLNKRKKSMRLNQLKDDESEMINHYFTLATKYNNNSYRIWHNYAMFNYKYYKFIFSNTNNIDKKNNKLINDKEILFAINAVNGFKNSLYIGGKNRNKTFQDLLRLIDIFFSLGDKNDNLLSLISETFNHIDVDAFLNVIPQLLCRFDIKDIKILNVLFDVLIKIGLAHPHAIISSLIVMKFSNSKKRKSAAKMVLSEIIKKNYKYFQLIDECEMFVSELNKCAMLLHEEWFETIEDIAKTFQNKDYHAFANQMMKMHNKMGKIPKNMYEIHFFQKFYGEIKEAEEFLMLFKNTNETEYVKEAWEIYHHLYKKISEHYKTFNFISLEYISTKLYKFEESNIVLPGTYYLNYNKNLAEIKKNNVKNNNCIKNSIDKEIYKVNNNNSIIRIRKIGRQLNLFNTKQHPRQMTMIGTDNKEYMFLLKGHEDLRQDERVMQLFDLVNTILAKDNNTNQKKLFINTYAVFPLSHNAGIIGWVPNCDTLHKLIKDQRTISNTIPSVEHRKVYKLYPKFESGNFLSKVEVFKEALNETYGTELNTVIWKKSKNCETWLNRRTNYSRSLAVMSIVGYILGLGDRHPSNLMMNRKTGKIIHIDFGDCFEVAMKRDKFPEKVPFRLTRMLIKALEVSGIEGTFRLICIKIMELLRYNKDSLLAILGSFIHDPLISFRLMIPMIMKKRKRNIKKVEEKKEKDLNNTNNNNVKENNLNLNNDDSNNEIINMHSDDMNQIHNSINFNIVSQSVKFNYGGSLGKLNQLFKNHMESIKKKENEKENEKEKEKEDEKIEDSKVDEKIESIHEEEEKKEKKKMEDDERQIFNLFEEKDEIESEELNKIAQMVLDRIQNKLSGTDFYQDSVCDAKTQVDKLITQATSYENLAQSYLGWCPFW